MKSPVKLRSKSIRSGPQQNAYDMNQATYPKIIQH